MKVLILFQKSLVVYPILTQKGNKDFEYFCFLFRSILQVFSFHISRNLKFFHVNL